MVYFALIPRVAGTVDEQYATTKSWTKGLQMLWATQLVDDEVNNGGFNQYFFNRSGQWAMEAIEGFRLIGVIERAEIVKAAVDQFFADAPTLRRYYQEHTLESFSESYKHTQLDRLDKRWYAAPNFHLARTEYIRRHPDEFTLPPPR
ncbi:MAG: DUF4375 domain-containing protein [Chloroflexi bacterium]|nr:MAG: DUF4375 domain-containing protein [Chloroflexota bacterium]